uniref:hypothetical protein n=1 Tax=Segatella hominis TaxID=2518605 RepID=UPI002586D7FE|nr:hypothetical protein [Prevotella sp.]
MAKRETAEKEEANYFMSQVEDVASEGYRSPASIFFQIDGQAIGFSYANDNNLKYE